MGAAVPRGGELAEALLDLGVPYGDVNGVLAAAERVAADRSAAAVLAEAVAAFVRDMGALGGGPRLGPDLEAFPGDDGPGGPWFALLVFAAARPYAAAYHREIGVPDEVSRRTLADVGRHVAVHRRRFGMGGLANVWWLVRHFRGGLYQLGRLQFERTRLGGTTGRALAEAGVGVGPGTPVLDVHIPDFSGPLDAAACDASFAAAREFFPRHFPDEPYALATCYSWLLDPQWAQYLAEDSNILRFQRRFTSSRLLTEPDDGTTLAFVFGDPDVDVARVAPRSTVQRAVLRHLAEGRHWYGGTGWVAL